MLPFDAFEQDLKRGKVKFKKEHLSCSNLSHYAAIINRVIKEGPENVSAVSKVFHLHKLGVEADGKVTPKYSGVAGQKPSRAEVDIVCKRGSCWIKVKAMSAEGVSAVVNGTATGGHKSVLTLADELVEASRYNLMHYKPPVVVFSFSRGHTKQVSDALLKRGVLVEGELVEDLEMFDESDVDTSEEQESDSDASEDAAANLAIEPSDEDITIVNLDVTTLITMVSQVTNDGADEEFEDELLKRQAQEEREHRTLPDLYAFLEGKDVVVTQMAVEKFLNIVRIVGGPKEQERARMMLPPENQKIRVVPNAPSALLQTFTAPRVKEQHRVIFGTGHALKATTATANAAFAATAKERGIFLSLYMHPARALTEQKELKRETGNEHQN